MRLEGHGRRDGPEIFGSVDDVPVSTAHVGVTGRTAGIYNVATPPEHRRHGYGEALTWAAVAEGGHLGCDHSTLQASPMGAPIYRRMGYRQVCDSAMVTFV